MEPVFTTTKLYEFTFCFLRVKYVDRLAKSDWQETLNETRNVDWMKQERPKSLNEFIDESYYDDLFDRPHLVAIGTSDDWKECEIVDERAASFLKGLGMDPSQCVIISGGPEYQDPKKHYPLKDHYHPIGLKIALDCVETIAKLNHCACLCSSPSVVTLYEHEKIRILYLEFDTESG